jgi:hypothetical protein
MVITDVSGYPLGLTEKKKKAELSINMNRSKRLYKEFGWTGRNAFSSICYRVSFEEI